MCKAIKITIFFFFCLVFFTLAGTVFAQEKINSFDVAVAVGKNSSISVQEHIVYDFGPEYKHGIFRDIYSKNINVQVKSVFLDDAKVKYEIINSNNNVRVKVGDPNRTITGVHHYIITYLVKGAVKFLPDHDELYWNVTGNNWTVPIGKASAAVSVPVNLFEKDIRLKCYAGSFGAIEQDCSAQLPLFELGCKTCKITTAVFKSVKPLQVGEGLTIVMGWPKGVVSPPGMLEKIGDFAKKYWPFSLPIIVFIYLFITWWEKGRDIKLHKSIVPQYDLPSDLKPAEVGYILNGNFETKSLSATIVDLAVRGYLKIEEKENKGLLFKSKRWNLVKVKEFSQDDSVEPYEKLLLRTIFEKGDNISVESLENNFYQALPEIKKMAAEGLSQDQYYDKNPVKVQKKMLLIGVVVMFASFFLIRIVAEFFDLFAGYNLWLPLIICAGLFLIFGALMTKKTFKGAEALWHIKGFKEYITKAEKYRDQFQEKENIFEKFLPYAIIFGCTKKWAKAFEGIYTKPPTWYEGAVYGAYFSPVNFEKSFNSSMAAIGKALATKPGGGSGASGFGGGGFSGGGFGGGGGGSW
ncbi:MAG: DUF2207 domain-containing protein [Candidatus Pacebacteria bacterium]|nr:DUF2207 domain-containing protein [Candidatus Paceibacterota bacterium]